MVAVTLRCGSRGVVLTTADAVHWQALRMGRHPLGLSPDGAYVAVPGPAAPPSSPPSVAS